MKRAEYLLDTIEKWIEAGSVGNLIIYHPPKVMSFGVYSEETIKARELPENLRDALNLIVKSLGATRGEFFTKEDGSADRIKIVRSVDV